MIIHPSYAIFNCIKTAVIDEQIQPNAIDFTADQISHVNNKNHPVYITTTSKQMAPLTPVEPTIVEVDGVQKLCWKLDAGQYDVTSSMYVTIPTNTAAMLVQRSTLARNGLQICSGLYDAGYTGHVGCVLHVPFDGFLLEVGTRIGQFVLIQASTTTTYSGDYSHHQQTHWSTK